MKRPLVIEFSGLPNSGKTTLLQNLEKLCNSNGINAVYIQETAELLPKCIPKGSLEQNFWINFETFQRILELKFISNVDFIFLDRGFYNQLFWVTLYNSKYPEYSNFVLDTMEKFDNMFNLKPDYLYVIDVTVDESLRRRMASSEAVTYSKKDFLLNYKSNFEKFAEKIDSKFYIDTTNMGKDEVAKTVFDQIFSLL